MRVELGPGAEVRALWDKFEVKTDQPPSFGGQNSAPAPFDLFLASLATCAGFYVLSFCQTRRISTEGLYMVQRTVPDPEGQGNDAIEMEIILPPEFPARYEKAVVRVANQCTVKKALMKPPEIRLSAKRA
ncbi:MAG: OsmC family protein [Desulfarculaceae bacterium]|nr:OsmC family protein [Desulfarculaceae bacterium]MCF8072413.1 OsmC family protein [Desulfarculaceae bacterium]MCF8100334.1 OsmC family protein [Desulfarculaceae bacterium]MCF8117551.1 OsmC family protein [Desulfarculaceae bacterium]